MRVMLRKGGRTPIVQDMDGFVARINLPGWLLRWPKDHGYGPLAMVVESLLSPGRVIAMHEHRNDEIISWVPEGVMRHNDRAGGALTVDADHLMVMNAGRSFWHSEETGPGDPPLRMLQILVRPDRADLEPAIQFGALPPRRPNFWRHIVGPEAGSAPFHVRNRLDLYDIWLGEGKTAEFPRAAGRHLYFYQFSGAALAGGCRFEEGEQGLYRSDAEFALTALKDSVIVAFLIDPDACLVRLGTVGDHAKIPSPALAPFVRLALRLRNHWRHQ
jgi:quercetin 2,3-dioxygenase